jgi:hypothetical protein
VRSWPPAPSSRATSRRASGSPGYRLGRCRRSRPDRFGQAQTMYIGIGTLILIVILVILLT